MESTAPRSLDSAPASIPRILGLASRRVVSRVSVSRWYDGNGRGRAVVHVTYAPGLGFAGDYLTCAFASCDVAVRFVMARVNRKGGTFSAAVSVVVPAGYDDNGRPECAS